MVGSGVKDAIRSGFYFLLLVSHVSSQRLALRLSPTKAFLNSLYFQDCFPLVTQVSVCIAPPSH